jgi:hypothetical protein
LKKENYNLKQTNKTNVMKLNLKTTVSVPTEVSIELETPAFFKNHSSAINEYLGVIEECTIEMWSVPGISTTIKNYATENRVSEIKEALDKWEHISEEEFFDALNKALKDFDFKATMRLIHENV